ncbi:hypothetical protein H2199_007414 [Coniosporium tulheliwenetii]|uniref:Uncharacterized protein n=1 Tax=Coniosporium tulheliwenetii TaxID=3383036 RepID=A0ACC2YPE6_9PEZI|nr:hypothetical protein H2199_007414 [Cladosporium sp. JES 115]
MRPFVHEEVPVAIRLTRAVGITASAFLAGQSAALSYILVPSILEAPAPLAVRQWRKAFNIGKIVGPVLSVLSGGIFAYLANREPRTSSAFKFYTAAAVLLPSIIPYTTLVMMPVNRKLLSKADSLANVSITDDTESGVAREETAHALIDKWAMLNLGRALMTSIGAFCGVWATLNWIDVVEWEGLGITTGASRMGD